jgi:hypothetical protein
MNREIDFKTKANLDKFLSIDEDHIDSLMWQGGYKRLNDTVIKVSDGFINLLLNPHNEKILFGQKGYDKHKQEIDYVPFEPYPEIIQ